MMQRTVIGSSQRRRGAYVPEFALIAVVFFLVLFGILEYTRYMFINQIVINAAREGARYAVVNTTDTSVETDTLTYVKQKMSGLDAKTTYYLCQVYMADNSGVKIGNASDAVFGQYIAVQVDYDYAPVLPNLLFLKSTMRITSRSVMYSEAN